MQARMGIQVLILVLSAGVAAAGEPPAARDVEATSASENATAPAAAASGEESPFLAAAFAPATRAVPANALLPAETETPLLSHTERRPSWGFTAGLGFGGAGGDWGTLLNNPVAGDFNIFRNHEKWRFGLGVSFTSFKMKEPYEDEKEWGFQQSYLFATRMFRSESSSVRPYLQARIGAARLHPRSDLFDFTPPPVEKGDSPTLPANGWSAALVPGVEFKLNRSLALDVSAFFNYFTVDEYDLSPVGYPPARTGSAWEARLGLRWHPDDGWPSGSAVAGGPTRERDAWGVSKNLGWAIGEDLALNWAASGVNEYIRNANFNQISPRSWWANFEHGLTYDDNEFKTNQYLHPWNGANYFNTGRSNGFGFWESSLFSIAGAIFWECCGETHPMSFNDLVSTGLGGMAVGEEMYRVSGQLLDNQDTGVSRVLREAGGFVVAPVRGFNRLVSGRASTVHDNPENPEDWRGNHARFFVTTGARIIGEGESISENTKTYGLIGINHTFGSVFDNERRKPFDSLVADYLFSPGDKQFRTVLRIRGDLWSKAFGGEPGTPRYAFAVVQHFDYHNNLAYEFGGQAFGPSLFARYRLSDSMGLGIRWDGWASVLAAVNADYSFLADVENERIREYDYGPGLGTGAEVFLNRGSNKLLSLSYRFQWITVSNGSIFNKGDEIDVPGGGTVVAVGSDADHYLQALGARIFVPLFKRKIGIGADGFVLLRNSHYYSPNFEKNKSQRNPEARIYLAFDLGH